MTNIYMWKRKRGICTKTIARTKRHKPTAPEFRSEMCYLIGYNKDLRKLKRRYSKQLTNI